MKNNIRISDMTFRTFQELENQIKQNQDNGYESAITGKNSKAVKYGSLVSDECELPDKVKNCRLFIWNNDNVDQWLKDNNYSIL